MWQQVQSIHENRVISTDIKNGVIIPTEMDPNISFIEESKCNIFLKRNMNHWRVKLLSDGLTAMKAPVGFTCVHCPPEAPHKAGYSPRHNKIWVCINKIWTFTEFRRVLLHEMIHAFDFARAQIDPQDCDQIACTEIRAYNLSHQCSFTNIFLPSMMNKFPDAVPIENNSMKNSCISHMAVSSLRDNKHCNKKGQAEEAVKKVFTTCKNDVVPFLRQPEFEWGMDKDRSLIGQFVSTKKNDGSFTD